MTEVHVLLTLPFPDALLERLRTLSPDLRFHQHTARTADELPQDLLTDVEILYTLTCLPLPEQAPNLRWVQFHLAGIDHVQDHPLLRSEEGANLRIPRGSLNTKEIEEIRSHVRHTYRFLERIPWGTSFRRIPRIAGCHHERLNGTGYPSRLRAEEIPLQSKIMSVADIFDALTASDRPYKKAVPVDRAMRILDAEVNDSHIDGELVRIFRDARLWDKVIPH